VLLGPIRVSGKRLLLDADARGGEMKVCLRDPQTFHELPGFTLDAADPIGSDSKEHPATWRGRSDLSALRGRRVLVHVHLTKADLYSVATA